MRSERKARHHQEEGAKDEAMHDNNYRSGSTTQGHQLGLGIGLK